MGILSFLGFGRNEDSLDLRIAKCIVLYSKLYGELKNKESKDEIEKHLKKINMLLNDFINHPEKYKSFSNIFNIEIINWKKLNKNEKDYVWITIKLLSDLWRNHKNGNHKKS